MTAIFSAAMGIFRVAYIVDFRRKQTATLKAISSVSGCHITEPQNSVLPRSLQRPNAQRVGVLGGLFGLLLVEGGG